MTRHASRSVLLVVTVLAVIAAMTVAPARWKVAAPAHAAGTGSVTLRVESARTVNTGPGFVHEHDLVTSYKWLITRDDAVDSGDPNDSKDHCLPPRGRTPATGDANDPHYADSCLWPSTRETSGAIRILTQGDNGDLGLTKALAGVPVGRYLISVTADGFKIDGEHFTVTDGATTAVTVAMQPYPLPLGTVRLRVFNDVAPVDGVYEVGSQEDSDCTNPGPGRACMAGFVAHLSDVLGEVTTDYYGNPLCTRYETSGGRVVFDSEGSPVIAADTPTRCESDANGDIVIPNLGPDRYGAVVVPPTGTEWYQTNTLEGAHDWDIWTIEGDTGLDTEMTVGQEQQPAVDLGFVRPTGALPGRAGTGSVKGTAVAVNTYIGGTGGVTVPETGVAGGNIRGPVPKALIALSDMQNNDQMVYMAKANPTTGTFDIGNVPAGIYQLTVWDVEQHYIIDSFQVEVKAGQATDVGQKALAGWFTEIHGTVFLDANANGKRDAGEQGVRQFPIGFRERDNSLLDQYQKLVQTDANGDYVLDEAYPLSRWTVLEAFHTGFKSTGITIQADNEQPRTFLGGAVDVSLFPVIGLSGRVDWGVQRYDGPENGGIVGTVTYDTTRNETDPADAVTEDYQPGVPNIPVELYAAQHDENGDVIRNADGSVALEVDPATQRPALLDHTVSEEWEQPRGCVARKYDGSPLTDQLALPPMGAGDDELCVEAPMLGWQAQPSDKTDGNFGQTVNGNYGFATSDYNLLYPDDPDDPVDGDGNPLPHMAKLADYGLDPQPLANTDYVVKVNVPQDDVLHRPLYKVTSEEDVNVFDGDAYLPQQNFPPTLTEANDTPAPPTPQPLPDEDPSQGNGFVSGCAGQSHKVQVTNPNFLAAGGSPFEGQDRPTCDAKLISVRGNQSVAPNFNLFTEVPLPTHFWGLTINDLGLSLDKRQVGYGEAQPLPHVPMGIYDFAGNLVDTVETDHNGMYEAIEPSTGTFNCPLPAGPCPNMYRFVGNDPGQPGHVNARYNPRFRTIATNFQAWPGLFTVTDTAPTQVGVVALAPGGSQVNPVDCSPASTQPQIFRLDRTVLRALDILATQRQVTITGRGFGSTRGTGAVTLTKLGDGPTPPTNPVASYVSWSDTSITVRLSSLSTGRYRLGVTAGNGVAATNGVAILQRGLGLGTSANDPVIFEVNRPSGQPTLGVNFTTGSNLENDHALQNAVNAASLLNLIGTQTMVLAWPAPTKTNNPTGDYFENVVMPRQVVLQGVGPGGTMPNGSDVRGSRINGLGFNPDNDRGTAWVDLVSGLTNLQGPDIVPDSAVVTVLQAGNGRSDRTTAIDGFTITGGSQADFATNVDAVTGGTVTPIGADGALVTQGGGIYVHGGTQKLQVTDNVIVGNSGSYGGAVRVGTPYVADAINTDLRIAYNQIRDNGGTNLAGGIGLFAGTRGYQVDHNDLCGNFSAEYGGALTHFGLSEPAGTHVPNDISNNRIWFNQSYDEGGAVMVAGELVNNLTDPSPGSGRVNIHENLIADNLANDDGGGIRMLQAGTFPINVVNNMIANNISAHEGGGIALDDSTAVRVVNNTIYRNLTTATAITSDGTPAPAGLSTAPNSVQLQAKLAPTAPKFSEPLLFNNIFRDNRAGSWNGAYITGIGSPDAPAGDAINRWDMAVADGPGLLSPTNSVLDVTTGTVLSATNKVGVDPAFVNTSNDINVTVAPLRAFPSFRLATIVIQNLPVGLLGDYHIQAGSPATNMGALSKQGVAAPSTDYDGQSRPNPAGSSLDAGADEIANGSVAALAATASAPGAPTRPRRTR